MKCDFHRLTADLRTSEAYDVYRHCMYMPAMGKYIAAASDWLRDECVRAYACTSGGAIRGMIVLALEPDNAAEIVGIAVAPDARGQGLGSELLRHAADDCRLKTLRAETDDEAVGFYRRNGFCVTEIVRCFDGQAVVRYRCTRNF